MSEHENLNHYDKQYLGHRSRWRRAYTYLAEAIARFIGTGSIVDMGCATGFLVESCRQKGFEAYGIDIAADAESFWPEPYRHFYAIGDISDAQLDIVATQYVTCMEVAEHLPETSAQPLVANLVKHQPEAVIFTAAPPGAASDPTHQNEQPYQYWIDHFEGQDYQLERGLSCALRVYLRRHGGVPYWYIRNLMVFVPEGTQYAVDADYISEEQHYLEMEYLMLAQLKQLKIDDHLHHIDELYSLYQPQPTPTVHDNDFEVDEEGYIVLSTQN